MENRTKKVMRLGNTLVVCLTPELKALGVKKGDEIKVHTLGNKIVISTDGVPIPYLSRENWAKFLFALEKDKKTEEMENVLDHYINFGIEKYVKDVSSTLFKIRIR